VLFNYLTSLYCAEGDVATAFVFIGLLLLLIIAISLLASTADIFFVPPLEYLSDKLKLSPDIAGITLLALGNGAPDVMTAISAGSNLDFNLLLSGLLGASIFISSGILASVIVVSKNLIVDRAAFYRDCIAYIVVTVAIIVVVVDGAIHLWEAILFLVIYVVYVVAVVIISCVARRNDNMNLAKRLNEGQYDDDEILVGLNNDDYSENDDTYEPIAVNRNSFSSRASFSSVPSTDVSSSAVTLAHASPLDLNLLVGADDEKMYTCGRAEGRVCACRYFYLPGIMLPENNDSESNGTDMHSKVQAPPKDTITKRKSFWGTILKCINRVFFVLEWPFSVLRWLSIPPCDGKWDPVRRWCSVISPLVMWMVILLDCEGWDGFGYNGTNPVESVIIESFPLWSLMGVLAVLLCVLIFFTTFRNDPYTIPRVYPFLVLLAFISAIFWMDIVANEAVAIISTLGIALDVSTAILGLTVVAIGNSVGDLVADLAVARKGKGKMAIASCFGSPLLNDILGVGIALTIATSNDPDGIIYVEVDDQVKLAWIFLGISLVASLIGFPIMKMMPTKKFAAFMCIVYVGFLVMAVIVELEYVSFNIPGLCKDC
jgi:sodium/potassium/calcium exchanger 6